MSTKYSIVDSVVQFVGYLLQQNGQTQMERILIYCHTEARLLELRAEFCAQLCQQLGELEGCLTGEVQDIEQVLTLLKERSGLEIEFRLLPVSDELTYLRLDAAEREVMYIDRYTQPNPAPAEL